MNIADLMPGGSDPFGRQPVEGVVAAAPSDENALLLVIVPTFDPDDETDPQGDRLRWSGPRGRTMPQPGDHCLVVYTKDGTAWVPVWWPG